jgi:hypothetical protein
MSRTYLALKPSEQAVMQAAAQIYSAYIANGKVPTGEEDHWIQRSVSEAIRLAHLTDDLITSDNEMG